MTNRHKMTKNDKEWRKLNHALQRFWMRTDTRSKLGKLFPHIAESEKEGDVIRTVADTDMGGLIPSFIHELLHWYYEKETADVPYAIHEGWIAATEKSLFEFLSKDKRRLEWWRAVVRQEYKKRKK